MIARRLRILLDTSVLVAGVLSPEGGAGAILEACRLELVELYLSPGIIEEATAKFGEKFPELTNLYLRVIREIKPRLIPDPARAAIKKAAELIEQDDAPILAAALSRPIDYLVTHDRDFTRPKVVKAVPFKVVTPGEFLEVFSE